MAKAKSRRPQRETKTASPSDDLIEKLDFTVAVPPATPRLSLHRHYGARYADGFWELEPGGAIQFRLQVTEPEHTTFALEVYSPFDAWIEKLAERVKTAETPWLELHCYKPDIYNPVLLTIGNEDLTDNLYWQESLNPLGQNFATKRMILAPAYLFPGDNFVTLWLSGDPGVVPLYLKSVSVGDFRLQRQQMTEWCWAAVTSSMMQFMTPERAATQNEVVVHTLKDMQVQSVEELNRPEDITKAAKTMGMEEGTRYGNVSRDTMRWFVNEGTPVPIQINWRKDARKNGSLGSGHYVVVDCIGEEAKGLTLIQIEDPLVGKLSLTWDELKNDYPGKANQHLYRHKERRQCPTWDEETCHCQWRGKWTYTHILTPKEWAEDQQFDESEYNKLIESVDTRLMDLAERDGYLEVFDKPQPTLAEVTARIEILNHQVVKLHHQIQDLEETLAQLEDFRQFLLSESSNKD
jgi:hypothetical protein